MKIERFEDIEAWQKARELTRKVYEVTSKGAFSRDYALKDQIRKASVSVMSNIAEGFERRNDKEFRNFLRIAKGSSGEVRSQNYVALDNRLVTKADFDDIRDRATEVSNMIAGFMRYLGKSIRQARR